MLQRGDRQYQEVALLSTYGALDTTSVQLRKAVQGMVATMGGLLGYLLLVLRGVMVPLPSLYPGQEC